VQYSLRAAWAALSGRETTQPPRQSPFTERITLSSIAPIAAYDRLRAQP
jgi:hypothetical protein